MIVGTDAKIWLHRIGTLLGLAGLIFVGLRLNSYAAQIDLSAISSRGYVILAALALIYGASNLLLALGWWRLLRHLCVSTSFDWALRAYAISQLAKYVPGNIFQFAGRQAIGVAAGIGNKPLATSTVLELALLVAGGMLFLPLAAPLLLDSSGSQEVGLAVFCALTTLAAGGAIRLGGADVRRAVFSYLIFLALSGAIFTIVYQVAGASAPIQLMPAIIGAYLVAWLAGLVTPGAPAGLGVREAVLLLLLDSISPAPIILLAVVLGRAVTVLGDVGFYLTAGVLNSRRTLAR